MVLQRATAELWANGRRVGTGSRAKGGRGGYNHAEQLAWNAGKNKALNQLAKKSLHLEFDVDALICGDCQTWFGKTLKPTLDTEALEKSTKKDKRTARLDVTAKGATHTVGGGDRPSPPAE